MGETFASMGEIFAALMSGDSWMISEALRGPGAWAMGLLVTVIGGFIVMIVYRFVPFLERNLEPTLMVVSYLLIGAIIFVEVFRRFVLGQQVPWSTTIPPFLFLIMTWFGCSYNVKLRTHLAFSEFRTNMPRPMQLGCLTLDAILWIGFCWIVVVTSGKVVANSASNFQIMLGTDNVMQWWFLISVPIAFIFLAGRAMQNLATDFTNFRSGEPLIKQAVIGGDA